MRHRVDPFATTSAAGRGRSRHDQPHPREVEQPKRPPTHEPPPPNEVDEEEPPGFKPPERREVEQPEQPPDIEPGREAQS